MASKQFAGGHGINLDLHEWGDEKIVWHSRQGSTNDLSRLT